MSQAITIDDFKPLCDELLLQVIQRDWPIASSLAVDCQRFITAAHQQGQDEVANQARELLDQLVPADDSQVQDQFHSLSDLLQLPEMRSLIFKHLELAPAQTLMLVDHLTHTTGPVVIGGLIRRGVLEHPNGNDSSQPKPQPSVQLIHALLDRGLNEPAADLIKALSNAKDLESSNFFVDSQFVQALLRVGRSSVGREVLKGIEEPLGKLAAMMRTTPKKGPARFTPAPLDDLYDLSAVGANDLARILFITGDYISHPVKLTEVASALGGPFSREELIDMGNYRVNYQGDTTVWFSNALSYWIENPETPWPFLNKMDEGDSAQQRLTKSILAYSRNTTLGMENHVHALAHAYRCHPFKNNAERERIMRQAAVLYAEGYSGTDETRKCMMVMREGLPRNLQVAVFPDKDLEMAIDLGL